MTSGIDSRVGVSPAAAVVRGVAAPALEGADRGAGRGGDGSVGDPSVDGPSWSMEAELGLLSALARGPGELVGLVADAGVPVPLGLAVGLLAGINPLSLSGASRVDLVAALERCTSMLAGVQQWALSAVVAGTEAVGRAGWEARFEVAAGLRLAPSAAGERVEVATALVGRLPLALAALERGEITWRHAAAIVAEVGPLTDAQAGRVEARVLARAGAQTVGELRRAVRRAVIVIDPEGAEQRHTEATRRRGIVLKGRPEGMVSWWATMPATISSDLWVTLTAQAHEQARLRAELGLPDLGLDALRVDVLVDAVLGNGGTDPENPLIQIIRTQHPTHPPHSTGQTHDQASDDQASDDQASDDQASDDRSSAEDPAGGQRWDEPRDTAGPERRLPRCSCGGAQTAAVVLDLPTLLDLADNPGHIPGYGPVPGPLARQMAMSRDWVRWLVDPVTGHLLDEGAQRYRPSDRLRRFVAARDRVCGFPGCPRPAAQCDCDHVVTFAHHGQTVRVNLGPLCRTHHNAKTHGLWQLSYNPDTADKTWTSPLGKTYTVSTDPVLT